MRKRYRRSRNILLRPYQENGMDSRVPTDKLSQFKLLEARYALMNSELFGRLQLIKKNDELAIVYDKIRVQESALAKGYIEYRNRLHELRALKLKLNDLKREHTLLTGSCKNIEVLRREVHNLSRELMQERTKVSPAHIPQNCPLFVSGMFTLPELVM